MDFDKQTFIDLDETYINNYYFDTFPTFHQYIEENLYEYFDAIVAHLETDTSVEELYLKMRKSAEDIPVVKIVKKIEQLAKLSDYGDPKQLAVDHYNMLLTGMAEMYSYTDHIIEKEMLQPALAY